MPRLTTIYTRKGDEGETSLGGGQCVSKNSARVAAYGTVDELNSAIGVSLAHGLSPRLMETLPVIQNELFHLGSDLAFREEDKQAYQLPQIEERHVQRLEELFDELNEVVGPLKNFILPGGSIGAAQLQLAEVLAQRPVRGSQSIVPPLMSALTRWFACGPEPHCTSIVVPAFP